jgi:hypothetical protein
VTLQLLTLPHEFEATHSCLLVLAARPGSTATPLSFSGFYLVLKRVRPFATFRLRSPFSLCQPQTEKS